MPSSQPDRTDRWRVVAFIAVAGLHLLAILFILAATNLRTATVPEQYIPLTLMPFAEPRRPRSDFSTSQAAKGASNPQQRQSSKDIDRTPMAAPNSAITVPNIDWGAEVDAAVRRRIDDAEAERRRRNLAGPSESQLDWARNNAAVTGEDHKLGDSERAEGGEMITWVSDKCYWTTHGATIYGMLQTAKVCKDPPKADAELFKEMRTKLDEREASRTP